ncbi:MAG: DUF1080 domain-containing protein [Planctomycetales bacterium]|nr:DUF1080 domain-containing protein [Planctomycetales bacterium]
MQLRSLLPLLILFIVPTLDAFAADDAKFQVLFNGTDLTGWKGADGFWSVRQGSIVGETTAEHPAPANTFLVWQGGEVGDFEFRCKVRFQGNNSGVQYRSKLVDPENFRVIGYQCDLHPDQSYFGMVYCENDGGRGIVAKRGERLEVRADESKQMIGELDKTAQLVDDQWNDVRIIAVGNRLIHQINGVTATDLTDNHPLARRTGILALQLHAGPAMKVEARGILLRTLSASEGKSLINELTANGREPDKTETKKINPQDARREWLTGSPQAPWVWTSQASTDQRLFLRKTFDLQGAPKTANLYTTCDNQLKLWINGQLIGESPDWPKPIDQDVSKYLKAGTNVIAAQCKNQGGAAGFVFKLTAQSDRGGPVTVISDTSWKHSDTAVDGFQNAAFDDSAWKAAGLTIVGKTLGVAPWRIPNYDSAGAAAAGDPLDQKNVLTRPGFVIDRLYRVPKSTEGSWVCLTKDAGNGFYASDQGNLGLFHITLGDDGINVEKLAVTDPENGNLLSGAQGLVWAFDSLWMHRNGGHLFRITDSNGDGILDKAELYPGKTGGGEHGNHAVIISEDGKAIYMAGGNHAALEDCEIKHVQTWDEDQLLPRMWDANGHARGVLAPGGWVTRLNPQTKKQELICIGFRNEYDIALNRFGDMFTYDADMEWDMGSPWYRPTRICQVVSGGDYGWRSGTGKFPAYYEDSLPPVVDIGPGSPTGVVFGTGAKFPTRYQDAMYALDWTFGTIYAVHMTPEGAGYTGKQEAFIYGIPLPVTDTIVGGDGHLYFTVGGRGTDSALYRARYVGDESLAAPTSDDAAAAKARQTRRMLETFHGHVDAKAVETAWPYLQSGDRFLRNAARVAIESQPVDSWADRVASESDSQARITASVALARMGKPQHQALLIGALAQLKPTDLPESQLLGLLRAYSLAFIRLGNPDEATRQAVIAALDPLFPHQSTNVNQELLQLLVYLNAPKIATRAMQLIEKGSAPVIPDWDEIADRNPGYGGTIKKMQQNPSPAREIGYALSLRNQSNGWTLDDRRAYFEFINRAAKGSGGASYPGFLRNIRDEALLTCTNAHREALQDLTGEDFNPVPNFEIAPIKGPGQKWTVESAANAAKGTPDLQRGRSLFFAADCGKCHRMAGLGGSVGPDLTSIPNKFDMKYVVDSIIHPSKVISDQYGSSSVLLDDGRVLTGIVIEKGDQLEIYPVKATDKPEIVARDEVEAIEPSKVSQMPEGLLDRLSPEEVRDLVAYLMRGGAEK